MPRDLTRNERISVARATQLIREAGWRDKAAVLDGMQQQGEVIVDPGLEPYINAATAKSQYTLIDKVVGRKIHLNPNNAPLGKGLAREPLERNDPELIALAVMLLHEADHVMCHGELEAFGEAISFCKALTRLIAELFPGANAADQAAIQGAIDLWEKDATRAREVIAAGGGTGYGGDLKYERERFPTSAIDGRPVSSLGDLPVYLVERRYPEEPSEATAQHMDEIARALFNYRDRRGEFPSGENADMVRALGDVESLVVRDRDLNSLGELVDPRGVPYVYRKPGVHFPDEFDLYSVAVAGDGEREEQIVLCELHRM